MTSRRLAFVTILAVILAVMVVRVTAFYCFPGCALYDVWDFEYWLFQCWQCPPQAPEG